MGPYYPPRMRPVIYCADIGSIPNRRFGWARSATDESKIERHRGGTEIIELLDGLAEDLAAGQGVALGFECPLFVPLPEQPLRLGMARPGERNRSWSAGAGAGAMATGIVEVAWILNELRQRCPTATPYLDWAEFAAAGRGLFLWEAFVTDRAKAATHVDDATVAVAAFRDSLPDPRAMNAVSAERPLSLLSAALLWSGWSSDADLLRTPCLVIRAAPPPGAGAGLAAAQSEAAGLDPTRTPRAHRDRREIERKRQLLQAPHVAPLTEFVRRLRAAHGGVPWFDPTEAGIEAPILLLFENPGRRADAAQGSGFISADNDDKSAENMWRFFREAGIDRRRDIVAWNIVPWYLGDDRKIGEVRASDIEQARSALHELLRLLPQLRVVVLFGRKAQAGWRRARPPIDFPVLEAPHPSGRWLNGHPEDRAVIVARLRDARRLAREIGTA
jgi:uracil-DNA glycosylase